MSPDLRWVSGILFSSLIYWTNVTSIDYQMQPNHCEATTQLGRPLNRVALSPANGSDVPS